MHRRRARRCHVVSGVRCHVSCVGYGVLCIMYCVLCIVCCMLYHVSCVIIDVSYAMHPTCMMLSHVLMFLDSEFCVVFHMVWIVKLAPHVLMPGLSVIFLPWMMIVLKLNMMIS